MWNFKKIVALGIVSTMVFGSSLTAFADDPTTQDLESDPTGAVTGAEQTVEGVATENYINKKIFKVTVPTKTEADKVLSFYTDPQGLIAETNAAQVGESISITDDTGVFFKNGENAISSWSDPLTFVNKSTSGVKIGIKVKLVEATTNPYAGGYSTTVDFTGGTSGGDKDTGLYIGLSIPGNKILPLTASEQTPSSYAKSAYGLYAVTYASASGYSFDIPEANQGSEPQFSIYANGALNKALADTTWYKVTAGEPLTPGTALAMPDIELKYTPTYLDAKQVGASFDGENLWVYNFDGTGFGKEATVADIKVNDKAVSAPAKCNTDGYLVIPVANLYTALGLTTDEEKAAVGDYLVGVSATIGGVAVYGNVE